VVLAILDTVRADRTTICGHGRPTTPVLSGLVEAGATVSCDTYAPGSWTLPSHTSFFTNLPVWQHGTVLARGGGIGQALFSFSVHPLPDGVPTLAERFAERGYATVLLSENSVVGPRTGLDRGFEQVHSWYRCGRSAEGYLHPQLEVILKELEQDDRPLFLVVNICQAHEPRSGAPEGVSWLEHHEPVSFHDPEGRALLAGTMTPEARAVWTAKLDDAYDWSVFLADRALGRVMKRLSQAGHTGDGLRLIVTSDHGEMLGEHGHLDHMEYLWEEATRIPLLVYNSEGPIPLPEGPLSGMVVHDLTLDGQLPAPLPDVTAVSAPSHGRPKPPWPEGHPGMAMAAHWSGPEKRLIIDGTDHQVDLEDDPEEKLLQAAPDDRTQQSLRARYETVQDIAERPGDPESDALLRELGYIE
jgi:uncharacterized sulfatase